MYIGDLIDLHNQRTESEGMKINLDDYFTLRDTQPTYLQYRIFYNECMSSIENTYPGERWSKIAEACEDRGDTAQLLQRTVTDLDIREMLGDTTGWMFFKDKAVSPWVIMAEMKDRIAVLIGGTQP